MWNILANDGMAQDGIDQLKALGHEVSTEKIAQEDLANHIDDYDVIIVRSATQVRKDLIDQMNRMKLIIRAGVGLDNIDVEAARAKGIEVSNTPEASSRSVAELAFAHAIGMARFLPQANRDMPQEGQSNFKSLKKAYSKGIEMEGKTMGIVGFGRIGRELAKMSLGAGMRVIAHDPWSKDNELQITLMDQTIAVEIPLVSKEEILQKSDFISVHTPKLDEPTIGAKEINQCKKGVFLINTSRGGVIDEEALKEALDQGQVGGCALDVFENEPSPDEGLLNKKELSLTPHIGASTKEAQNNIGKIIVNLVKKHHG